MMMKEAGHDYGELSFREHLWDLREQKDEIDAKNWD